MLFGFETTWLFFTLLSLIFQFLFIFIQTIIIFTFSIIENSYVRFLTGKRKLRWCEMV